MTVIRISIIRYLVRLRCRWVIGKMYLCLTISRRITTVRFWWAISIQDFIIVWVSLGDGLISPLGKFQCFFSCSIAVGYKKSRIESIKNETWLGNTDQLLQNYRTKTESVRFSSSFLYTYYTYYYSECFFSFLFVLMCDSCRAGYNGHECLLRAVCEAADTPLGMDNGVLGDILHIILTYAKLRLNSISIWTIFSNLILNFRCESDRPSTSEPENIPHDFNEAELYGTMGLCDHYSHNCPQSIFDVISVLETYWNESQVANDLHRTKIRSNTRHESH